MTRCRARHAVRHLAPRRPGLGLQRRAGLGGYLKIVHDLGQTKKLLTRPTSSRTIFSRGEQEGGHREGGLRREGLQARKDFAATRSPRHLRCNSAAPGAPRGAARCLLAEREARCPHPLAGHTNSYHTYSLDEALQGIAAGATARRAVGGPGLDRARRPGRRPGRAPPAPRRLRTRAGQPLGALGPDDSAMASSTASRRCAGRRTTGSRSSTPPSAATSRADENEAAFLANIGELADAAERGGSRSALEIHGDIMASGAITLPLLEKIGRDSVGVNYDTANVVFYSGDTAVDDLPKIVDQARPRPPQGDDGRQGHLELRRDRQRRRRLGPACPRSCATPATTGRSRSRSSSRASRGRRSTR